MRYFKLDENKKPVPCTQKEWTNWRIAMFGNPVCSIGRTEVGKTIVSTVFMGLCQDEGDILPFETIAYDSSFDRVCYATWEEAEKGHKQKVDEVTNLITSK